MKENCQGYEIRNEKIYKDDRSVMRENVFGFSLCKLNKRQKMEDYLRKNCEVDSAWGEMEAKTLIHTCKCSDARTHIQIDSANETEGVGRNRWKESAFPSEYTSSFIDSEKRFPSVKFDPMNVLNMFLLGGCRRVSRVSRCHHRFN